MPLRKSELLDVASDWSLDPSELKSSIGRALVALSDAMDSLEAQNNEDLTSSLEDIASDLYELVEEYEEEES